MQLSLDFILHKLKGFNIQKRISYNTSFDSLRLLDLNDLDLDRDTLYITNVRDFGIVNNRIKERTLIVSDHMSLMEKVEIGNDMNLIVVKERVYMETLMNYLIDLFESMNKFENELRKNVFVGKDIWVSIHRISETFNLDITILKEDFNYLNNKEINGIELNFKQKSYINERVDYGDVKEGELYPVSENQPDLFAVSYSFDNRWIHVIIKGDSKIAQLKELLYFLELLKPAMKDALFSVQDQDQLLKQILLQLLYNESDEDLILNRLTKTTWNQNSQYQLFLIDNSGLETPKQKSDLEKIDRDSCIVRVGGTTVMLVNHDLSKFNKDKFLRFVENNELRVVESNIFDGIGQFKDQYFSASALLTHAGEKGKCLSYLRSYPELVAGMLKDKISLLPLVDYQVLKLYHQDQEEGSDNLDTLYIYLRQERSYLKASKLMNLHRNSIVYRIGKVQESYTWNLDDEDVRGYIIFSYELLKFILDSSN